jgi:glycosyl transferase, family 25
MIANVISIQGSNRRQVASQRAKNFNYQLVFFDAIDLVKKDVSQFFDVFDANDFINRYSREPSSGDIGCLLSHYALWKKLSNENKEQYHLILEDDFIPKVKSNELLEIIKHTKNFDVLLLGYSKVQDKEELVLKIINPIQKIYSTERHNIGRKFRESTCGAVAYVVSKNFVDEISKSVKKPSHVLDDWSFFKKNGFTILHVQPLCFHEDFLNMKSNIKESGRFIPIHDSKVTKKNLIYRFLRSIFRFGYGRLLSILMFLGIFSKN